MTEELFQNFCKQNKLDNICIISKNSFSNKPNIIGCNKSKHKYIIYSTNTIGISHIICTLKKEKYAFKFLYSMLKYNLDLEQEHSKVKKLHI